MPQLKIKRGDIAKITIEGREYDVRDGVVTVHSQHMDAARSLGFGDHDPDPIPEVGKDLPTKAAAPVVEPPKSAAPPAKPTK